jgi:hypothetical protein
MHVREPLTFIEKSDSALQFSRRIRPGYMQVVEHPDGRQSDELRSGYKKIGRVVGIVEATGDAKPALQCGFLRGGSLSASWKIDSTRPKLQLSAHPRHHNTMFAQSFRASVCCSPSRLGVKLTPLPPQRQALARVARQQPVSMARRTFITPTAVRSGDSTQLRGSRQY